MVKGFTLTGAAWEAGTASRTPQPLHPTPSLSPRLYLSFVRLTGFMVRILDYKLG